MFCPNSVTANNQFKNLFEDMILNYDLRKLILTLVRYNKEHNSPATVFLYDKLLDMLKESGFEMNSENGILLMYDYLI